MARIETGWYEIKRVPEGTTKRMYIYNDGEYPIVDNIDGKEVLKGFFGKNRTNHILIVSPDWVSKDNMSTNYYIVGRFMLLI